MTFAIFIVLIFGVFIGLLNVLPDVTQFPIDATSSFGLIVGTMRAWDFFFPIHELLILVTAVIVFEVTVWFWHVSWRIVKFMRGHSDGA